MDENSDIVPQVVLLPGKLDVSIDVAHVTPELAKMEIQRAKLQYLWPTIVVIVGWIVVSIVFFAFILIVGHLSGFSEAYALVAVPAAAVAMWPMSRFVPKLLERVMGSKGDKE